MSIIPSLKVRREVRELRTRVRTLELSLDILEAETRPARATAAAAPWPTRPDGRPALHVLRGGTR